MKREEILFNINKKVEPLLAKYGFKYQTGPRYKRKTKWGNQIITVYYRNRWPDCIEITGSISFRIEKIEVIRNLFEKKSVRDFKDIPTYGVSLIVLGTGSNSINVINFDELDNAVDKVCDIIENVGLSYLDKNKNLIELDKLYNDPYLDQLIYVSPFFVYYRVILAKLLKKPDFEHLVNKYTELAPKFQAEKYTKIYFELADYLLNSDLSEFDKYPLPTNEDDFFKQ